MSSTNDILMMVVPRKMQIDGTDISRILPYAKKRMVGPFIFLDHMPETHFQPETGMNVRPHPHIGLSTLSYLLQGTAIHRDSLGNEQLLKTGDVNWMTAGRGIAHSERIPTDIKSHEYDFSLLQFWIALPLDKEEIEPSFSHYDKSKIPTFKIGSADVTLIAGEAFDKKSPVEVFSSLFFFSVTLKKGETFNFTPRHAEEASLYRIKGEVRLNEHTIDDNRFVIFDKSSSIQVEAIEDSYFVIFGGMPFPEERHIFWNFVSSSVDRIEQAKQDWIAGKFPKVIHETEFIPFPENLGRPK